jgi:hypothetical protein
MYYKIVEYFGPKHPSWTWFASDHWVKPLTSFDSIDATLCPDLFSPTTDDEWAHRVPRDSMANMITDFQYAVTVYKTHAEGRFVGVEEDEDCDGLAGLLGYDIIDYYDDVSLITNWCPTNQDHPLKEFPIKSNGLIGDYKTASEAASLLRQQHAADDHAAGATVWAVFVLAQNNSLTPTSLRPAG